jgi:hypothetical protein
MTWKERLLALTMAGATAAACTLTKQGQNFSTSEDPCFSAPDPVQCSTDRAAGKCAGVPDTCCGQANSFLCSNNVCHCTAESGECKCCFDPNPTACAMDWCRSFPDDCPGFDASVPEASTGDAGATPSDAGPLDASGDDGGG